jgi:hypothetical protein
LTFIRRARHLGDSGDIQGKGVGTALLRIVENSLLKDGSDTLLVNAAVGARGFFLRNGYVMNMDGFLCKTRRPCISPQHQFTESRPALREGVTEGYLPRDAGIW